jgi:hypothetical protein
VDQGTQDDQPLVRERVVDDVKVALAGKRLRLVTSDADLFIAAHAATSQDRTLNTFYDGLAAGGAGGALVAAVAP